MTLRTHTGTYWSRASHGAWRKIYQPIETAHERLSPDREAAIRDQLSNAAMLDAPADFDPMSTTEIPTAHLAAARAAMQDYEIYAAWQDFIQACDESYAQ